MLTAGKQARSSGLGGCHDKKRLIVAVGVVLLTVPNVTSAQARVEKNVVYGMYSGLGLLMDVYRPSQPNSIAIVAIQGSGWYSPIPTTRRRSKLIPS